MTCWTRCWGQTILSSSKRLTQNTALLPLTLSHPMSATIRRGKAEEQEDSPVKPSLTPEPPRKIPKPSSSPPVKRTLNLKTKKAMQKSAVVRKFVQLPTQTPIRIPHVPGWGGTFGNVTLINTCPVDNFLTIVYTRMKDVPQTSAKLSLIRESWAEDLVSIEKLFD